MRSSIDIHDLLHRRRRPGRDDARLSAGARRRRHDRSRETRRLSARFSRRHDPSLDAAGDGRSRASRRVPETAASGGAASSRARSATTTIPLADFSHLPDAGQIHRPDAAMGFSQFSGRQGEALSELPADDERRGRRPYRRERRRPRCHRQDAGRTAHHQGRSDDRRRWPPLDRARQGGLMPKNIGAPMDVLWFRADAPRRRSQRNLRPRRQWPDSRPPPTRRPIGNAPMSLPRAGSSS